MSETPIVGWPYPVSSDLIADGAVNIEQLAESSESTLFLPTNKFAATDAYTSWPIGHALMYASGDMGWPYTTGQVVTIKITTTHCYQWFYSYSTSGSRQGALLRTGYTASGNPVWSKWDTVTGPGTPEAQASGNITMTPKAGEPTSVNVSFPSGRFEYAPAVFTQYRGSSPGVGTSPASVTATGFTLSVVRDTATSTYVYWQAVSNQGE